MIGGDDVFGYSPPAGSPLPEESASSDKEGARRSWCGAKEFTSGERMLAGRTPAKPRWSEVMMFLGCSPPAGSPLPEVLLFFKLLLRQTTPSSQQRRLGKVQP